MIEKHEYGQSCPDVSSIFYPPQLNSHFSGNYMTAWQRHHAGSFSPAELSQNETVPCLGTNSVHVSFPDSLALDKTFAALAAEAQNLWGSASNFASICSSASTMTSSSTCAYPTLAAASSFGLDPSSDCTRFRAQYALFENSVYPGVHHALQTDPSQLCTLSAGSGHASDAELRWEEPSAVESQVLEEYSLGSVYPRRPF